MTDVRAKQQSLWRLSGLERKYGPSHHFNGEYEANEMVNEIAVFLVCAILVDADAQRSRSGRGRPRDVMIPELAPNLLWYFLRYHSSCGRRSVIVTAHGKKRQEEAGPLFEFIKAAIEPLNQYLIRIDRKPLSPARLARYALHERRRTCSNVANNPAGATDGRRGGAE